MWNGTRGDRGLTSNLQPPLPTHTGCYVSVLTSSPGLRAPINSQPYGFQLWRLADVCPTHCSLWHTRDLVSPFGGVLEMSVRFWLSVFIRWVGVFPVVKLRPAAAVIYTWKWCQSPTVPAVTRGSLHWCWLVRSVFSGLHWCATIKFPPQMYRINSIIKTVWGTVRLCLLSDVDGHVLTWFSLTTEQQAAVSSVRHTEALWGLAGVSCSVNTLNTTC